GYECVIIKIRQSNFNNNNNNVYETVRAAWKIGPNELIKLKNASKHYVLAVVNGIVKGVYNNVEWKPSPSIPGRYEFKAEVVPRDQQPIVWQDCQIPGQYRVPGLARPVIITW
ncbi:MAG: hypothetical protein LBT23_07740, partial [Synergistaceae bacterium]|nr:hypothetical protein [Synergistaceae bacterium]